MNALAFLTQPNVRMPSEMDRELLARAKGVLSSLNSYIGKVCTARPDIYHFSKGEEERTPSLDMQVKPLKYVLSGKGGEWLRMGGNGWEWFGMVGNGWECRE